MKKSIRVATALAIAGTSVLLRPAWAEGPLPPLAAPPASTPASPAAGPPGPPPPVFAAPPASPPAPPARDAHEGDEEASTSDHDRFVKHLGVTYFDVTSIPIANPLGTGGGGTPTLAPGSLTSSTVAAPVVGVRYWIQRSLGVDIGLGLGFAGGSQEAVSGGTDVTVGKVGTTGFAFHAGLPIVLYDGRHYAFLVIPHFTVGVASGKLTPAGSNFGGIAAAEQDLSGFLFDGGGKIGAEIYFGFIGLPELALQATVGLSYRRSVFKLASAGSSASDGTSTFGTNVEANPWAIFTNNISATYYF
jgi:hypothetical protein